MAKKIKIGSVFFRAQYISLVDGGGNYGSNPEKIKMKCGAGLSQVCILSTLFCQVCILSTLFCQVSILSTLFCQVNILSSLVLSNFILSPFILSYVFVNCLLSTRILSNPEELPIWQQMSGFWGEGDKVQESLPPSVLLFPV